MDLLFFDFMISTIRDVQFLSTQSGREKNAAEMPTHLDPTNTTEELTWVFLFKSLFCFVFLCSQVSVLTLKPSQDHPKLMVCSANHFSLAYIDVTQISFDLHTDLDEMTFDRNDFVVVEQSARPQTGTVNHDIVFSHQLSKKPW